MQTSPAPSDRRPRSVFAALWVGLAIALWPGALAAQVEPRDPESALKAFRSRYKSGEPGERVNSLKIVLPFESPQLVSAVRNVVVNDDAPMVQNAAIQTLGHWGTVECAQAILSACDTGKLPVLCLDQAGDTLGGFFDDAARDLVRKVLAAAHRDVRYVSARALGHYQSKADVLILAERIQDADAGVRLQAARALGLIGERSRDAGDLVVAQFDRERDWRVRSYLVELIAKIEHPHGLAILVEASADENLAVACTAAKWLGQYPASFETLRDLITSKEFQKGAAAVRGIARIHDVRIIPTLIERIDQVHRRVQGEILYVLGKLTGKRIGPYPDSWMGWWEQHKSGFVPEWDAPYEDRPEDVDALWEGDVGDEGGTVTFFGLELFTKNVVFVLDVSKSMLGTSYDESYKRQDGGAETRPYIERVKDELEKAVQNLPSDARFNVYFFDGAVRKVFKKMTPASKANKKKAVSKARAQGAEGNATNFHEAFKTVFEEEGEIDMVVFLSDGRPTQGIMDPHILLQWLEEKNRGPNICIHAISVGFRDEELDALMRGMTSMTGGRFIHR